MGRGKSIRQQAAKTKWGRVALRRMDAECAVCGHPWGEHDTLRGTHGCQSCEDCPAFVPVERMRLTPAELEGAVRALYLVSQAEARNVDEESMRPLSRVRAYLLQLLYNHAAAAELHG